LVGRLPSVGRTVVAVDQLGIEAVGAANVTQVQAHFGDPVAMREILRAGDVVYLLAGGSLPDDRGVDGRTQLDATVGATLTFLDSCVEAGVARVLFPSSGGTVYGIPAGLGISEQHPTDPLNAYGVQKLAIEKYLAIYRKFRGLDSIVMRIGNPFGPGQDPLKGQGLIAAVSFKALTNAPIEVWGDGEVVRDFLFIDDLVDCFVSLVDYDGPAKLFNVGAGIGRSVNQVIQAVAKALPAADLNIQRSSGRPYDVPINVLDIGLVMQETGWRPTTGFSEGVAQTVAWCRAELATGRWGVAGQLLWG